MRVDEMKKLSPSFIDADAIGIKCRCGNVARTSEFENGLCPVCRIVEQSLRFLGMDRIDG